MADYEPMVWVFLIERGLDAGSDFRLFWNEDDANAAARDHLAHHWPVERLRAPSDVREVIEEANLLAGSQEYLVVDAFPITGQCLFAPGSAL